MGRIIWGAEIYMKWSINSKLMPTFCWFLIDTNLIWKYWLVQQEWPEDVYPPYANGPGYIITSDIAKHIISQYQNQSLRVCNSWFHSFLFNHKHGKSLDSEIRILPIKLTDFQNGGCEHGYVGWELQQFHSCTVLSQLEILSIWMYGRLFHSSLSVSTTDVLSVEQFAQG